MNGPASVGIRSARDERNAKRMKKKIALVMSKMLFKSKFKFCALVGIAICVFSLLVHLFLANYATGDFIPYKLRVNDFNPTEKIPRYGKLWGSVNTFEALQPYANPRTNYPVPGGSNGFIYVKIYGGFDKIRSSICDVVAVSRLLNATLVIPEIQESVRSKGISSKFKSFSYLYNEDQFIAALSNDVAVVKNLPDDLREDRKKNKFPIISLKGSSSPSFYIKEILPKLKKSKVVGFVIADGGCLESILPSSMAEYQRLRCRVAFHALQFRPEILSLGNQMVARLRAVGRPYLAYHPGLVRDTLAFHGCAELYQDVHTELVQYRRKQMIKRGIVHDKLSIDSAARKRNGSCPLMPEEVGLLLRALGYPPNTIIFLAGAETFGGQRVLIPFRSMYTNTVDRTILCSKKELSMILGPESPLPFNTSDPPSVKSDKQLSEEWKKAGQKPRPLPPPPSRPFYQHEKDGWYGWVGETDKEPDPSPLDVRMKAHRLIWDALDYYVSVEANAFFPGFHNDGSGWPDFSSLIMGHRLYQMASGITYRPDREALVGFFETIHDHVYHPKRNWTASVRNLLNQSLGIDGFISNAQNSKPTSFLSHPLPECSCRASKPSETHQPMKGPTGEVLYGGEERCPEWMVRGLAMVIPKGTTGRDEGSDENEPPEDYSDLQGQSESQVGTSEQDEEMDPDD